jgi:hypothetical protein
LGVSVNHRGDTVVTLLIAGGWSIHPDYSTEFRGIAIVRDVSGRAADGLAAHRCTIIAALRARERVNDGGGRRRSGAAGITAFLNHSRVWVTVTV